MSLSRSEARVQIQAQVRSEYGDDAEAVLRELDRYVGRVAANRERVQRAILERSGGSFGELKRWVEAALADDRDFIAASAPHAPDVATPVAPPPNPIAAGLGRRPAANDLDLDEDTIEETSFASLLSEIDAELDES